MEFELPSEIPVMTLPNVVFFPQALLPLHIFEPRYRAMIQDVLQRHRMFAVAQLDQTATAPEEQTEPLHHIASAGIIRACQKNENGTSDLILQGLCRIEVLRIVRDDPYRFIEVRPLFSVAGGSAEELSTLRDQTARLFALKRQLGLPVADGMAQLVQSVADPEAFADLAGFALCEDSGFKQQLLETLATKERLQMIARQLEQEIRLAKLQRQLQGGLGDDQISHN
jgi:Lon protease-like protein